MRRFPEIQSLCCLPALLLAAPSFSEVLYDVDFSSPPHVVGFEPLTGLDPAPRDRPSGVRAGDPLVIAGLAGLNDQPLEIESYAPGVIGDVAVFKLDDLTNHGTYQIAMDVSVESIGNSGSGFRIQVLGSTWDLRIEYTWAFPGQALLTAHFLGSSYPIGGGWTAEVPDRIGIHINRWGGWEILLNGVPQVSQTVAYLDPLVEVSLSTIASVRAIVDNVLILGGTNAVGAGSVTPTSTWGSIKALYR